MNLDGLETRTTVEFCEDLTRDDIYIGGELVTGPAAARVSRHLDHVRALAGKTWFANVVSENNFPTGAGIASSASAFAALSLAATSAIGLTLSERELSVLARLGSGSASRSIPAGFVEWYAAPAHRDSYAESFAPPDHWDLVDLIAIVSRAHKETGSTEGHSIAVSSPLQSARIASAPARLAACKKAILERDFMTFAAVVEQDSTVMHAVMMTGTPPLFYWQPASLAVMALVRKQRAAGMRIGSTLDAGANVHCICASEDADAATKLLRGVEGVSEVLRAGPGGGARLVADAD
jgi:diphosphomevalonate decarboxylase